MLVPFLYGKDVLMESNIYTYIYMLIYIFIYMAIHCTGI